MPVYCWPGEHSVYNRAVRGTYQLIFLSDQLIFLGDQLILGVKFLLLSVCLLLIGASTIWRFVPGASSRPRGILVAETSDISIAGDKLAALMGPCSQANSEHCCRVGCLHAFGKLTLQAPHAVLDCRNIRFYLAWAGCCCCTTVSHTLLPDDSCCLSKTLSQHSICSGTKTCDTAQDHSVRRDWLRRQDLDAEKELPALRFHKRSGTYPWSAQTPTETLHHG